MSTRAQIGFYADDNVDQITPDALIYRHSDGYPTGGSGVVPFLIEAVPAIVNARGCYDTEYLAAQVLYRFIQTHDQGQSCLGYGISNDLHADIRFYYAVTPEGVYVFDARTITEFADVDTANAMFFSSWVDDERRRKIEAELKVLTTAISKKQTELEGLKRKKIGK